MLQRYRLMITVSIALCCALAVFAFTSPLTLAAQRPLAQQQKASARRQVCPTTVHWKERSDAVKKLQAALNKQGYKDAHGHTLRVDGVFGDETLSALKGFQAKRHLKVDGVASTDVWRLLGQCNTR